MKLIEGRDPMAWLGILGTVIFNVAGLAWLGGKFDEKVASHAERLTKLEAKAEKDAEQDVKIAVISNQLATISEGVGEIKGKLEQKP